MHQSINVMGKNKKQNPKIKISMRYQNDIGHFFLYFLIFVQNLWFFFLNLFGFCETRYNRVYIRMCDINLLLYFMTIYVLYDKNLKSWLETTFSMRIISYYLHAKLIVCWVKLRVWWILEEVHFSHKKSIQLSCKILSDDRLTNFHWDINIEN